MKNKSEIKIGSVIKNCFGTIGVVISREKPPSLAFNVITLAGGQFRWYGAVSFLAPNLKEYISILIDKADPYGRGVNP